MELKPIIREMKTTTVFICPHCKKEVAPPEPMGKKTAKKLMPKKAKTGRTRKPFTTEELNEIKQMDNVKSSIEEFAKRTGHSAQSVQGKWYKLHTYGI